MFSVLPGSVAWCLTLIWKILIYYYFKYFFFFLAFLSLSKIGLMLLIPIPPIALRILLGFCFQLLYLVSTPFTGSFMSAFRYPCFSYLDKNKTKQQTLSPSRNPGSTLCLISSLFSLSLSNFSEKSFVFAILQKPPLCLKLYSKRSPMTS